MSDNPFPNVVCDAEHYFGRPRVLPSGVLVFALAGPVIYGGETCEATALWMDVTVAEVAEAVAYERARKGLGE